MAIAHYYRFTPCCVGAHPAFFAVPAGGLPFLPKVYTYSGPTVTDSMGYQLEAGKCYYVEELTSTDLAWVASLLLCPTPDPVTLLPYIETSIEGPCPTEPTAECPCEIPPNPTYISYSLQPCCGGEPTIIYFVDEYLIEDGVYIYTSSSPYGGLVSPACYTANRYSYTGAGVPPFPQGLISDFALVEEGCGNGTEPYTSICDYLCLTCECRRFLWTGTVDTGTYEITYIDCNNEVQTLDIPKDGTTWTDKVCMKTVLSTCPNPGICWTSESFGDCTLDTVTDTYECNKCYELVDCAGIEENIYTLNQQVGQYVVTQQVIQIQGSDTCWTVHDTNNDCNCAVNVSVQFVYSKCDACLNPKGYLLTECTTGATQYTTTDLSEYTNLIIQTDCGGCWTVTELDIIPPTSQPVVVVAGFTDCEICNATFYQLVDCIGVADTIFTITDLSQYVGEIVELKYCPETCWRVSRTTPQEVYGDVIVLNSFGTVCADCLTSILTPQCATFTNTGNTVSIVTYVDIDGNSGLRHTLAGGQSTTKECYLSWQAGKSITVTEYGICVDGTCPPDPSPLIYRGVTPGYNTAGCSPEYYEKVVCNYSELLYKDVLEKRYGISSCCSDEINDWEIKYEMLMLAVLVNPDYSCLPSTNCGCRTQNDCGYICDTILYPTCPDPTPVPPVPPACVFYEIAIKVVVGGTVLHYKDCYEVDTAIVIPPNKVEVTYTICGAPGQTANDIYCEFPVLSFSFVETTTSC